VDELKAQIDSGFGEVKIDVAPGDRLGETASGEVDAQ